MGETGSSPEPRARSNEGECTRPGCRGYFRVWRTIFDHWLWPTYWVLWTYLIGRAVYRDGCFPYGGGQVYLKRGQLMTAYSTLAKECGMAKSTAAGQVKRLEGEDMIRTQTLKIHETGGGTVTGTRITVLNYDNYQALPGDPPGPLDAAPDAAPDIEEVSTKENTTATTGSLRQNPPPTPTADGWRAGSAPEKIQQVLNMLRSIPGMDVDWPADQLSEMAALLERVPLSQMRTRVQQILLRESCRGKRPYSLRYFIRAIKEDHGAGTRPAPVVASPSLPQPPIRADSSPPPPRPPEPDRSAVMPHIQDILDKLGGGSNEP